MKTILIVDDSATVRQQVTGALKDAGYAVREAVDGVDGAEKLAQGDVALVLCDVNMPRMTGIELVEKLKREAVKTPPIVMLTTEGQPDLIKRAREAGAKGWIVKPFKAPMLVQTVNKLTAS